MTTPAPKARLAVVVSHPTQYYSPWFRWIATHAPVELRVFYLWNFGVTAQRDPRFETTFQWDVDLLGGYASEFVPNVSRRPGAESFWGFRNPQLNATVHAWQPDALLLFGYRYFSHLQLIRGARRQRLPLIFRGDSHFLGRPASRGWRGALLRAVYRRFAAVTYVGAANRDYFRALGVPDPNLFFAPHAVDASRFDPRQPAVAAATADLRARLGLAPATRVVLFAGKFVSDKQPLPLLRAFIAAAPPRAALVFVGDGPEKEALQAAATAAPERNVHFLPFANQSQMPAVHALADVFVLPSRGHYETWGLAVNEAMHLGVPCLVSDRVGCQRDLVTDGETGWVFRHDDPAHLGEKLTEALQATATARAEWSARVQARVAAYSYAAATAGLLAAVDYARRTPPR